MVKKAGSTSTDSAPQVGAPTHAKSKSMMQSPIKHSTENFNPYEHLVAKLTDLPLIHIHAAKNEISNPDKAKPRRISQIALEQAIPKGKGKVSVSLPWIFILAAGEVSAKLGGPESMVSVRTTTRALTSMIHTGKPPTEHRKTGKSAMGAGTIPENTDTCTTLDADGNVVVLEQDAKNLPPPDAELHFTQLYKPFEQIIADLGRTPPETKLHNSPEEILRTGIMEVKINSKDKRLSEKIFRINLATNDFQTPLLSDLGRKLEASQPAWWSQEFEKKFGSYEKFARKGFPVEYANSKSEEFKPYRVAADKDEKGNLYVITGDQDLFTVPRSQKYNLGKLGYERIDTHTSQGVDRLIEAMKQVHHEIIKADILSNADKSKINDPAYMSAIAEQINASRLEFSEKLLASKSFLADLGSVTPYVAYFILETNQRVVELTQQLKENPEVIQLAIEDKLKNINVTSTVGFHDIPTSDIDIHPAWIKQDPVEACRRLDEHVNRNFYISSEIMQLYVEQKWKLNQEVDPKALFKHMEYLTEAKDATATIAIEKTAVTSNAYVQRGSQTEEKNTLTTDILAGLSNAELPPNWKIHTQTTAGTIGNMQVSSGEPIKSLLIEITHDNGKPSLIQVQGNQITANESADDGYKHIQEVLAIANINMTAKNQFTPVIFSGSRLEAQQTLETALNSPVQTQEFATSNRL